MKFHRDWRFWASLGVLLLVAIVVTMEYQRLQIDHVELARDILIAEGHKRKDLHVVSVTINRSLFVDESTVQFQIGNDPNANKTIIASRVTSWLGRALGQ